MRPAVLVIACVAFALGLQGCGEKPSPPPPSPPPSPPSPQVTCKVPFNELCIEYIAISSSCCKAEQEASKRNESHSADFCTACKQESNAGIKEELAKLCKTPTVSSSMSSDQRLRGLPDSCGHPTSPVCNIGLDGRTEVYSKVSTSCCPVWRGYRQKVSRQLVPVTMDDIKLCTSCGNTTNFAVQAVVTRLQSVYPECAAAVVSV